MTKIRLFFIAFIASVCYSSYAQFQNSDKNLKNSWGSIYAQWNPSNLKPDLGSSLSFNGYSLGFNYNFVLSKKLPFFIGTGIGVQYSRWSRDEWGSVLDIAYVNSKEVTQYSNGTTVEQFPVEIPDTVTGVTDCTVDVFSAKIPINVGYRFNIANGGVAIVPYAGIDLRYNISGTANFNSSGEDHAFNTTTYTFERVPYTYDASYNTFDKDDMSKALDTEFFGDGDSWKRFQAGWHVGIDLIFGNVFTIGASYGEDFSKVMSHSKVRTTSLTIGIVF
jgi:hypothetical protein